MPISQWQIRDNYGERWYAVFLCPFLRLSHNAKRLLNLTGVCYLCIKTVERSQTPNEWWEEIKLPNSYKQALEKIDEHLPYWPQRIIHRCKQRLTKIWQYLLRMRRLRKKVRPELVSINTKVERRERIRERKALVAANIENQIKKQLLERLNQVRISLLKISFLLCFRI